jgi:hypothetical protein
MKNQKKNVPCLVKIFKILNGNSVLYTVSFNENIEGTFSLVSKKGN